MKIDIISDLHVCHWIKNIDTSTLKFKVQLKDYINNIMLPSKEYFKPSEVLVIAGDISHYNNVTKALLIELKDIYKNIIITFGNHEMYLVSKRQISKYNSKSENRLLELKEMCKELDVHYLDGNVIDINGVKFGGTGSWYNIKSDLEICQWKIMNDSRMIYSGIMSNYYNSALSPNWTPQDFWHKEKAKLLEIAKEKCDVFITHMALNEPTKEEGMCEEFIGDSSNIFFYTNNIELLKMSECKVHIHGHTHSSLSYIKEGIHIVCNPLGYPGENTYNLIKQIEIKL